MSKKILSLRFQSSESRLLSLLPAALLDDGSLSKRLQEITEEDQSKLLLLCRQYGIQDSPFMFHELSLALARELYPEPKKRGRQSKWVPLNQGALVVEIERLIKDANPAHGVAWACGQIAKREPWKSFIEIKESDITTPDAAEALRKVYYNFKNDKWAKVMREAFGMYEHEDAIEEWEKQVADFVRNPHPK